MQNQTAAEIIEALGNTGYVATAIGTTPSTVASWKKRGRIPHRYWPILAEIAKVRAPHITLRGLVNTFKWLPRQQDAATEQQIQRHIMSRFLTCPVPGVFAFHVPNGGKRPPTEAKILKGVGVTAGVPDLAIVRAGLLRMLEIKTVKGKLSKAQKRTIKSLQAAGVEVKVSYGLDEAVRWLEEKGFIRGVMQ